MAHQFDHHAPDLDAMTASFAAMCGPGTCLIEPTRAGCTPSITLMVTSRLHHRFRIAGPDRHNEHGPVVPLLPGYLLARNHTGPYANVPSTAAGAEPSPPGAETLAAPARPGFSR